MVVFSVGVTLVSMVLLRFAYLLPAAKAIQINPTRGAKRIVSRLISVRTFQRRGSEEKRISVPDDPAIVAGRNVRQIAGCEMLGTQ